MPRMEPQLLKNQISEEEGYKISSNFSSPSTKKKQSDPHGFVEVADVNDVIW